MSCTANARRPSMEVSGPPTATVTNWPGRNRAAMAGATRVSAWYASTRRTVSTVARTWTGPAAAVSLTRRARPCWPGLGVRVGRRAQVRGVLLQRPHADLTADDGLDALHRG